jgi:hypothetical protein
MIPYTTAQSEGSGAMAVERPELVEWRRRKRVVRWVSVVLISVLYLGGAIGVVMIDYESELSKVNQNNYTDTVPVWIVSDIVTTPMQFVLPRFAGYPDTFDAGVYRHRLAEHLPWALTAAGLNAVLLAVVLWLVLVRGFDQRALESRWPVPGGVWPPR